jgi:hypothetical protein
MQNTIHPFSKLGERVVALCQNDENLHHFHLHRPTQWKTKTETKDDFCDIQITREERDWCRVKKERGANVGVNSLRSEQREGMILPARRARKRTGSQNRMPQG